MAYARKNEDGIYVVNDSINLDRYSMEGYIAEILSYLADIRQQAVNRGMVGEGYVDFSTSRGYYDSVELEITFDFVRTETEKERSNREEAEAKADAKLKAEADAKRKKAAEARKLKKDAEYAEFVRLKAKFGDAV